MTENPFTAFFENTARQLETLAAIFSLNMSTTNLTASLTVAGNIRQFPIGRKADRLIRVFDETVEEIKEEYHDLVFQIQQLSDSDNEFSRKIQALYEQAKEKYYQRMHNALTALSAEAKAARQMAESQNLSQVTVEKLKTIESYTLDQLIVEFWSEK